MLGNYDMGSDCIAFGLGFFPFIIGELWIIMGVIRAIIVLDMSNISTLIDHPNYSFWKLATLVHSDMGPYLFVDYLGSVHDPAPLLILRFALMRSLGHYIIWPGLGL